MEKKMENEMDTGIIWGIIGVICLYRGYIGLDYIGVLQRYNIWIMEKNMETTILIFEL